MTIVSQRLSALRPRLAASAEDLIERGAHGVALSIVVPGVDAPLAIAVGMADPARQTPLAGNELFPIASQSKMFTAALVLQLAREGMFDLDQPVAGLVRDVPAVDAGATIAQFLNHSSGIGNFIHALTTLAHPWPVMSYDDLMALARMHGRQSAPGERMDYNNTDIVVLARLCELVTGRSRAALLAERLWAPLGMDDTMIGFGDAARRARFASGYYDPPAGPGGPIDVATVPDLSIAGAAGDITSSLADMQRWLAALTAPERPIGLALADFTAGAASAAPGEAPWFMPRVCGRGMESWCWGGRAAWGHRGSFFGYHSASFVEPRSGVALTMMMTMSTAGGFMRFIDTQAYGYMRLVGEAVAMACDAAELP